MLERDLLCINYVLRVVVDIGSVFLGNLGLGEGSWIIYSYRNKMFSIV